MKDEDALERVLAGLREVEAPSGMEGRVLRRMEERESRRSVVCRWSPGLVVALVGVLAVSIGVLGWRGEHALGAKAPAVVGAGRPGAEALGYLEAGARRAQRAAQVIESGRESVPQRLKPRAAAGELDGTAEVVPITRPGSTSGRGSARRGSVRREEVSFPAPEEAITGEEKMLVRLARHGSEEDVKLLNPEMQAVLVAEVDEEFEEFVQAAGRKKGQ